MRRTAARWRRPRAQWPKRPSRRLALGASALKPAAARAYACGRAPGMPCGPCAGVDRAGGLRLLVAGAGARQARPAAHLQGPRDPWLAAGARSPGLRAGGLLLRARGDHRSGPSLPAAHARRGEGVQRQPSLPSGPGATEGRGPAGARHLCPPRGPRRRLQRFREGALHDPQGQVHGVAPASEHQARARSSSIFCRSARRVSRRSCASRARRISSGVSGAIGGTSVGLPSSSRATIVR
jgi:hypothetical protein